MPDFLRNRLGKLHEQGNFRTLPGKVQGVDFWSNDYLGFGARPQVQGELMEAKEVLPAGASGSRSISGDDQAYHALEARIAGYHGQPAALVYNSGYTANLGLLSALLRRTDTIIYDELVHASCRDGIRLGQAQALRFAHNDPDDLKRRLKQARPDGQTFVLTEGRFSMDGDLAPLADLALLCREYGAHLIVDEAHSGGLEGSEGAGLVAALGLQSEVFATIITYGKAFGAHGAAVLGEQALRDYLINFSRPFIYTTGPAPAQWAGIAAAYDRMAELHEMRMAELQSRIDQFNSLVEASGLRKIIPEMNGPIQIVHLPGNEVVMAAETACQKAGLLVKGIRSPTVSAGQERLRICLHAFNTEAEVARLVNVLGASH